MSVKSCTILGVFMATLALCSCTYGSYFRPVNQANDRLQTSPSVSRPQGKAAQPDRKTEWYGVKVLSRLSSITLESEDDNKIIECVPFSAGVTYRRYIPAERRYSTADVEEFSFDLLIGASRYTTAGVERSVFNDALRFTYLQLWDMGKGFYAGGGLGVQLGEIKIEDTDYRWVPPQAYKEYAFVIEPVIQGKVGYDTGMGLFIETTGSLGIGISLWSLEFSLGFYF